MYRVFLKFFPIYSSLKISLITKATFVKLSMLYLTHVTLKNCNISKPEWPPLFSETFTK